VSGIQIELVAVIDTTLARKLNGFQKRSPMDQVHANVKPFMVTEETRGRHFSCWLSQQLSQQLSQLWQSQSQRQLQSQLRDRVTRSKQMMPCAYG